MLFRKSVLATAVAVALAAGVEVSTEDQPDNGVRRLLERLETILPQGDPAAYHALLADSADRAAAESFVESEMRPGITAVVLKERERLTLPPAPAGTAYRIVADVFQASGARARVATWRLDVALAGEGAGAEWRIVAQTVVNTVENLARLSLRPDRQFAARHLSLRHADLELVLPEGAVFTAEDDRGISGLVLLGAGTLTFQPRPVAEQTQLKIFGGSEVLDTPFDGAFVRLNPVDFERLVAAGGLVPMAPQPDQLKRAERIFREDSPKSYALDLGDLSPDTWSFDPPSGDLTAEIHTRRFGTLTYVRAAASREDVSLSDRARRLTIALYSSASDRPAVTREGESPFTVRHFEIDVSASPERRWIDGRARLTVRAGARALRSLTLRLADSLAVESVTSDTHGRLFSMRVNGQSSLLVALPDLLPPGAEMRLTLRYAGRLEPQAVGTETAGQPGPVRADTSDPFDNPAPSFLYSSQSAWYPQPITAQYATARLRITLPATLTCIASGEASPPSAPDVPEDPQGRRTYVFNTTRPLRYFAFLASRLDRAHLTTADAWQFSVATNPGHIQRGREAAARVIDITEFYESLLGDVPYPTFTAAFVESDQPGGHSPGYFAVINQPVRGRPPFEARNDPAPFGPFPDYFLAHELAHQWWGQAVGWRSYRDQWLSEGFSQYFAALYAGRRGEDVSAAVMRHMHKWAVDETAAGPISLGVRLGHIQGDPRIYRALVYNKGALVLHMMRQMLGDDAFFRGLRRFYETYRYRLATTDDFRVAMEAEAGRSLAKFFGTWIHGSTLPRLGFGYRVAGDHVVVRIEQQQPEAVEMPLVVTLQYADRTSEDVLLAVDSAIVEARLPLRGRLRLAEVSRRTPPLAEVVRN